MPGAGPHLGSGLLGNPEHRYHSSQLGHHQGNPGQWTLIQMTRSIPSQKLHWSWMPGCRRRTERRCVKSWASPKLRFPRRRRASRSIRSSIAILTLQNARTILILATTLGLRFHVSAYGMYGFAIFEQHQLSSDDEICRQISPTSYALVTMEFTENDGCGICLLNPLSHARIDARLYKFIVEMKFGIMLSLHQDIMGPSFFAREFQVTYPPTTDASKYATLFGAPVKFGQSANRLLFNWVGSTVRRGLAMKSHTRQWVGLCDAQLEEFRLSRWLVGHVRQILMKKILCGQEISGRRAKAKHERAYASTKAARRKRLISSVSG